MPRRDLEIPSGDLWEVQHLLEKQISCLVGCDEAGRGPLAGPVVCAAVQLKPSSIHPDLRDSKKIKESKRAELFDYVIQNAIAYHIQFLSAQEIDQSDILSASLLGMEKCARHINPLATVVVDGSQLLRKWDAEQYTLVKGDDRLACIAAASILAKVSRDRFMLEADELYPQYGFAKHKGYPTAAHLKALSEWGPCPLHRMSFKPLSQLDLFGS